MRRKFSVHGILPPFSFRHITSVTHGSELAFKAFLRAKGYSIEHLKKLGYDLHRLVKASEKGGLSDVASSTKEFRAAIDLINPYYREKELELSRPALSPIRKLLTSLMEMRHC